MLTHVGTQQIETERLILRPFTLEDTESAFCNWAGDESVQNDCGEPVYDNLEKARELLQRYIDKYEYNDVYRWAVIIKQTGECAGQIAYFIVDSHNMFGEIEYCMGKLYQNKGYITEAVKAVVDYGFVKVGFNRVQVSHRHVNIPSKRVIEKCGFTYEGTLRRFFNHLGEFHDRLYYSILRDEWQKNKLQLVFPALKHKQAALEYRQEHFENGEKFISGDGGLDHTECYEKWLKKIQDDVTIARPGFVRATIYLAMIDDRIVGTIQIRHTLNNLLLSRSGHIGYGVRPSERCKGYASKMLSMALEKCKELGIDQALVTCNKENTGSAKTIIKNGGLFENEFAEESGNIVQRYWIDIK